MSTATEVLVIPHTHWDRAWYWPFARLQVRLIECVSTMLALCESDPTYRFSCDGQAMMLADYLEARPQDRDRVIAQVRAGRVKAGPLYCQPDLYCTGGEALIRNLLIGRRIAQQLGGSQTALHLPDTFGLIPSLPMIAAGFGIGSLTFMRGLAGQVPGLTSMTDAIGPITRQVPPETRLFRWRCPDGSAIAVCLLRDGYANAADLGRAPGDGGIEARYVSTVAVEKLIAAARRQDDQQGAPLLLLAGSDHQIPDRQLSAVMATASQGSPYRFRYSDFDQLGEALAAQDQSAWPSYQGEFHGDGAASVLGGTISTRVYLKLRNARAERLLTQQIEPAAALVVAHGIEEPALAALRLAWTHLLKTHPHDDICGCSVDAVHRDNEFHFQQTEALADGLRRRLIRRLAEHFGGIPPDERRLTLLAFNAQAQPRSGVMSVRLDCEGRVSWGDYQLPAHYAVVDEQGREVPYRECWRGPSTEHPHQSAELEIHATLPPTTLTRFYIEPRRAPRARARAPHAGRAGVTLRNARLTVTVDAAGVIAITDRRDGTTWAGLGLCSDQADIGDSYDFCDLAGEQEQVFSGASGVTVTRIDGRSGVQAVRIERQLRLPEGVLESGPGDPSATVPPTRRSRRRVTLLVSIELSLAPDAPQLECRVQFTNTVRDHRLRWNLSLPAMPTTTRAGLKFNQVVRPVTPPPGDTPPRIHPDHPADHFIAVEDPRPGRGQGLALFAEGPFNYEVVATPRPRLALTLLRAVGWLTRGGLTTRASGAGPTTPTPEAQCLGRAITWRFALRPFQVSERDQMFLDAALWRAEPLCGEIAGFWPSTPRRPVQGPFIEASEAIIVSAYKPTEDGDGSLVRLFNPTPHERPLTLTCAQGWRLEALDLDERPTTRWSLRALGGGRWSLAVPPFGLRSCGIRPTGSPP